MGAPDLAGFGISGNAMSLNRRVDIPSVPVNQPALSSTWSGVVSGTALPGIVGRSAVSVAGRSHWPPTADTRRLSASLCLEPEKPAPPRTDVRKSLVRRALGVNRQQFSGIKAADVSRSGRSSDIAELGVPRASPQLAWQPRPPEGATKATLTEAMHAVHAEALKALQGTPAPPRGGGTVSPGAAWRVPRRPDSHEGAKGRGMAREPGGGLGGLDSAMAFSRPGTQGGAGSERTCSASSSDSSSRKGSSSSAQQQQTGGALRGAHGGGGAGAELAGSGVVAGKGEEGSGSESEVEEEEDDDDDDAGGSDPAPNGAAPPPKRRGAGADTKAERRLALRRVQERRRTLEAAAEARERLGEAAREGKRKLQEAARQDKEERDRYRAEVLAINRLLAQRDEENFRAYMAQREPELEEVQARHAAEVQQHAQARKAALREVAAAGALRQQQANEREREKQAKEREAAREALAAREAAREAKAQKEQEREAQRAQVYALNKLMRQREEQAFSEFCEARGGLPPEPPPPEPPPKPKGTFAAPKPPPTTDTVLLVPAVAAAASEVAATALSPAKPRRKRAGSTSMPGAAIATAAAVAIGGGTASSHGAEVHKKKQEYVASALELRRSHAREKGEEREAWRAQIYALNALMKAREDASFSYFKELMDVRDAGGDESALPPPPSTGVPKALVQIQEMLVDKREELRGTCRAPPPPPPQPPPPKRENATKPPPSPSPIKRAAAIPAGPASAPLALPLPPPVVSEADTPLTTKDQG